MFSLPKAFFPVYLHGCFHFGLQVFIQNVLNKSPSLPLLFFSLFPSLLESLSHSSLMATTNTVPTSTFTLHKCFHYLFWYVAFLIIISRQWKINLIIQNNFAVLCSRKQIDEYIYIICVHIIYELINKILDKIL